MKIYKKESRTSVKLMVDLAERGNFEELLHRISYLNGLYSAFYTVAMLDDLSRDAEEKFILALEAKTNPKIEEKNEDS